MIIYHIKNMITLPRTTPFMSMEEVLNKYINTKDSLDGTEIKICCGSLPYFVGNEPFKLKRTYLVISFLEEPDQVATLVGYISPKTYHSLKKSYSKRWAKMNNVDIFKFEEMEVKKYQIKSKMTDVFHSPENNKGDL